jgi:hypothetical protein
MSYLEIGEEMQLPAHMWSTLLVADGPADSELLTFFICSRQLGVLPSACSMEGLVIDRMEGCKDKARRAQKTGVNASFVQIRS